MDHDDTHEPAAVPPLKPFSARGHHGVRDGASVTKPGPAVPPAPAAAPHRTSRADAATALGDEHASLHIARDVHLSGAITACDKLMVDGHVEADMPHARVLVVGVSGRYGGRASVENADIAGHFEGELEVTGRLTIRAGGRVAGTIAYGRISIETGGEIAGQTRVIEKAGQTRVIEKAGQTRVIEKTDDSPK